MTVGEIKTHFEEKKNERKMGILDGETKIKFNDNFEMTTEELCSL